MFVRGAGIVAAILAVATVPTGCAAGGRAGDSSIPSDDASGTSSTLPAPEGLGVDRMFTADGGISIRVTVLGFDPDAAPTAFDPPTGGRWTAAEVRTCADSLPETGSVDWSPWSAVTVEGDSHPPSTIVADGFPMPLYPVTPAPLAQGDCTEGWIVFPVPAGARVDRVLYAPTPAEQATWNVR